MALAEVARFYGWTHNEIMSLKYKTFLEYKRAIDVLRAREKLHYLQVSSYPHLSEESYNKLWNRTENQAYPWHLREKMGFDEVRKEMERPW